MSAPKNNQFWKQRSQHGRDLLFGTPDLLWQAATEYFEWCDENPWVRIDFKGKDADQVEIPTARPYTLDGFCLYCSTSRQWWDQFKKNDRYPQFDEVITRIEETIRVQKMEGAIVGAFNANIVSRDLGLIDKKAVSAEVEIKTITGMRIL